MTQEEKSLLIKDLCARLPYNVIVKWNKNDNPFIPDGKLTINNLKEVISPFYNVMPYLRPMSSMTEEEEKEYLLFSLSRNNTECLDWLNAHHFDYRWLILKGLALEAPKGMYK